MSNKGATLEHAIAEVRHEFNGRWGRLWARTSESHSFHEFWGSTLSPSQGETVLEVACGVGNILVPLARAFPHASFVGIDISDQMVSLATQHARRLRLGNIRFEVGDMTRLQVGDGSVDHLIVSRSFGHYSDLDPVLSELARVVRPGGTALLISQIQVHGFAWAHYWLLAAMASLADPGRRKFIFQYLDNTPALEELTRCTKSAGLVITEIIQQGFLACIVAKKPQHSNEEDAHGRS